MPTTIALVSCVKLKREKPSPARDLYVSPLFRALRRHAETHADEWYILSAEHGLLAPEDVVGPYERTLNRMRRSDRIAWAEGVQAQLLERLPRDARVMILAGARYREHVTPFLRDRGWTVTVPLERLRMGQQLRRLNELAAAVPDGR